MYYIHNVCCLCLQNTKDLKQLSASEKDAEIDCYKMLKIFLLPKIYEDSVISNQTLICNKCCDSVEEMHVFRERCIKNINLFKTYVRQLRTYSKINGTINIQLTRCDQPAWSPNYARKQKQDNMKNDKQKYFNRCTMRLYGTPKFDGKFNNIDANLSMLDDAGYHESFENGENHEEIMEEIYRVNFDQKLFEIEENYDIGEKYNQIFSSQEQNEVFVKVEDIKTESDDIESTSTNDISHNYTVSEVNYDTMSGYEKINEYIPQYVQNYPQNNPVPDVPKPIEITNPYTEKENSEISSPISVIENHGFSPQKHRSSTESLHGSLSSDFSIPKMPNYQNDYEEYAIKMTPNPTNFEQFPQKINNSFQGNFMPERTVQYSETNYQYGMNVSQTYTPQPGYSGARYPSSFQNQAIPNATGANNGNGTVNNVETKHECEICKITFVNASFLEKHMAIHKSTKNSRPYKCDFCPKTFQHVNNLVGHRKNHTKEKNFKCEICGKGFAQHSHLTAHQRFHTATENVKAHACQTCQMCFVNAEALAKHEIIHTGQKPYACTICTKAFPLLSSLLKHQHMHNDQKAFRCDVCQKGFAKEHSLEIHKRLHTGDRPFQCDVCGKAFFHQTNLNTHMRIHSTECPFKCDICDRSFVKPADLSRHRRTHPTVCPFKCPDCNKSFSEETDLENHKRIHQQDCPFKCNTCNKAFLKASDLSRHARIHSGDKPFVCQLCNMTFNRSDSLLKHKRCHNVQNVVNEKPSYQCDVCSKTFAHNYSLNKHLKTHQNAIASTTTNATTNSNAPSISNVSGNGNASSCTELSNVNV